MLNLQKIQEKFDKFFETETEQTFNKFVKKKTKGERLGWEKIKKGERLGWEKIKKDDFPKDEQGVFSKKVTHQ
jgi:hypothetical protein